MRRELHPAAESLMHDVKTALDPRNLINPGKVLAAR
jgi:FAD/FMN-containing dehydrogenase